MEEIVQDLQPRNGVQLPPEGGKLREPRQQIGTDAGKIAAGFLYIPLRRTDGEIPFLYKAAPIPSGLGKKHPVVFPAEPVQFVALGREQQGFFQPFAIHAAVVDGDFCAGTGIERVEQFGVVEEHGRFCPLFPRCCN